MSKGVSAEDRKASILAAINGLPASRRGGPSDTVRTVANFTLGAWGMVLEASKARRLSTVAYIRRATLAMAAHDLEVPFAEALALDPRVARESGLSILDPDGVKFGLWEIERLVGEVDDAEAADPSV